MPSAPPTEFIGFLPAPGESILTYNHALPPSAQPDEVPRDFVAAMTVRRAVFVDEQHVAPENELDADDHRSFHWVLYVSVSHMTRDGSRKGSETSKIPAATMRLVPPPHAPHPSSDNGHQTEHADGSKPSRSPTRASALHDGKEPYAKLGRLATLPAYRGLGLAGLVVSNALEWAGAHPFSVLPLPSPTSTEAAKAGRGGLDPRQDWKGLVLVHAQKRLEGMYRRFGFETDEGMGEWMEEGIEHVGMWKRIPVKEERGNFR
ncbi:MAG: hypothetical protein M1816_002238 [Peltula sp. TS41687]|nr:MAG: hypothetical protein M1816_002238 [Peltula sp. TS41687]